MGQAAPDVGGRAATAVAVTGFTVVEAGAASSKPKQIKNVIYLLGDGMGRVHVTAARERNYGADGKLNMETMLALGQVSTYAVAEHSGEPGESGFAPQYRLLVIGDRLVVRHQDLQCRGRRRPGWQGGAHADGTGQAEGHADRQRVDRRDHRSYAGCAIGAYLRRGCQGPSYSAAACQDTKVTGQELPTDDVRVTPIADQVARNGTVDVICGGGLARFDGTDEKALADRGYTVLSPPTDQTVATRVDLQSATGGKVFALFNRGNMTVEKYKREHPDSAQAQEPNLAEMTLQAIELLTVGNSDGFYLQVEGAHIDKWSHATDERRRWGSSRHSTTR